MAAEGEEVLRDLSPEVEAMFRDGGEELNMTAEQLQGIGGIDELNELKTDGADLGDVEDPTNLDEIQSRLAQERAVAPLYRDDNLVATLERQEEILESLQEFRGDMDSLTGEVDTAEAIMQNGNFKKLSDLQTSSEWKEADDDAKLSLVRDNTSELRKTEEELNDLKSELKGKSEKADELKKVEKNLDEIKGKIKESNKLEKKIECTEECGKGTFSKIMSKSGKVASFGKKAGAVIAVGICGYEVLVANQLQTEADCLSSCKDRNNEYGKDPDGKVPEANCPSPPPSPGCEAYCDTACSKQNRITRAENQVGNDPFGSLADLVSGVAQAPLDFFDSFRRGLYLIGGLILLVIVYYFAKNWVSGKGAALKIKATTSGLGNINLDKYRAAKGIISEVNG